MSYAASIGLSDSLGASRDARIFTRDFLSASRWPGRIDEVLIIVSELVANAAYHGKSSARVALAVDGLSLRVEVHDDSSAHAALNESPTAEGGLGLTLVDALSSKWGCSLEARGKTVWAELEASGPRQLPA